MSEQPKGTGKPVMAEGIFLVPSPRQGGQRRQRLHVGLGDKAIIDEEPGAEIQGDAPTAPLETAAGTTALDGAEVVQAPDDEVMSSATEAIPFPEEIDGHFLTGGDTV